LKVVVIVMSLTPEIWRTVMFQVVESVKGAMGKIQGSIQKMSGKNESG